jgi:hypothetical protein
MSGQKEEIDEGSPTFRSRGCRRPRTGWAPGIFSSLVEAAVESNESSAPLVFAFSKTAGFRHGSIPTALDGIGHANGFAVDRSEDPAHSSTAHLGDTWVRADDWCDFQTNPCDDVNVLQHLAGGIGTPSGASPTIPLRRRPHRSPRCFRRSIGRWNRRDSRVRQRSDEQGRTEGCRHTLGSCPPD